MRMPHWWDRLPWGGCGRRSALSQGPFLASSMLREISAYEVELAEVCQALVDGTSYASTGDRLGRICTGCMHVSPSCSVELSAIAQAHGEVLRALFRLAAARSEGLLACEHIATLKLRRAAHSAAVQRLRERLQTVVKSQPG